MFCKKRSDKFSTQKVANKILIKDKEYAFQLYNFVPSFFEKSP